MLRMTKLTDYSIVLLQCMAAQSTLYWSAAALAEATKLPQPTVSKLLKIMVKKGFLLSLRGAKGGYQLKIATHKITLFEIVAMLEGSMGLTACAFNGDLCQQAAFCRMRETWQMIEQLMVATIGRLTLEDFKDPRLSKQKLAKWLRFVEQDSVGGDVNG